MSYLRDGALPGWSDAADQGCPHDVPRRAQPTQPHYPAERIEVLAQIGRHAAGALSDVKLELRSTGPFVRRSWSTSTCTRTVKKSSGIS